MDNKIGLSLVTALIAPDALPSPSFTVGDRAATVNFSDFDPDSIRLYRAAGGFNFVLEMATDCCLRVFGTDLDPLDLDVYIDPQSFRTFLAAQQDSFGSAFIRGLKSNLNAIGNYTLSIFFHPLDLELTDPTKVRIRYRGYLVLQNDDAPMPADAFSRLNDYLASQDSMPLDKVDANNETPSNSTNRVSGARAATISKAMVGSPRAGEAPLHVLGALDMTLLCNYF